MIRCDIKETCACGAELDFSESVPDDAWKHQHQCLRMVDKFHETHKLCQGKEATDEPDK